jgi:hypothetical protein
MSINYDLIEYGFLRIFIDSKLSNQKPVSFNKDMMSYSLSKTEKLPEPKNPSFEDGTLNTKNTEMKGGKEEISNNKKEIVFAINVRFPEKMFQTLIKKTPEERNIYFSDRTLFQELLISSLDRSSQILEDNKENKPQIAETIEYNVIQTLGLIFPTKFPAPFYISTSYGEFISPNSQPLSFPTLPSISSSAYSYITINAKKYTITKILWLNDFYNHPVYQEFIRQYMGFYSKIENAKKTIETDYIIEYKKIIERLKCNSTTKSRIRERNNLCILDQEYSKIITEKLNELQKKKQYSSKFKEELEKIQSKLNELQEIIKDIDTNIDTEDTSICIEKECIEEASSNIYKITTIVNYILKLYELLKYNRSENIILPSSFQYRLKECKSELKKLYVLNIIKTEYIFNDQFNINISNEEQDVIKKLESSYKWYIDFIKQIKEITPPNRISLKSSFQELLDSFIKTKENKNNTTDHSFKELLEYVKYKIVYQKPFNSNLSDMSEKMNVGVNQIDLSNTDKKVFEIYISLDLLEDEINDSNINNIKCDWRGLYLGNKVENYLLKTNQYDAKKLQLLISKNELYANKNAQVVPPPIKGGRKTRKYKQSMNKEKKSKRHSIKNR